MLCEVLDIDLAIVAKARVHGEESCFDAFYLHALHQFTAEVQSCGRSHHGTLFGCEYALIALGIGGNGFALDIGGQGSLSELVQGILEFLMASVVKESESAAARGGVVDNLGHHRLIVAEVQFIADANLACRLYKDIP